MDRVRDRVRVRGLAIAAPSYSGPNRFQWGRKLEFAQFFPGRCSNFSDSDRLEDIAIHLYSITNRD